MNSSQDPAIGSTLTSALTSAMPRLPSQTFDSLDYFWKSLQEDDPELCLQDFDDTSSDSASSALENSLYTDSPPTSLCGRIPSINSLRPLSWEPDSSSSEPGAAATSALPCSTAFPGRYQFQISFEPPARETKAATWTYSESLHKLYVRMAATCPVRFRTSVAPPAGAVIRALPVYTQSDHVQDVVTRCPNHATADANSSPGGPPGTHFVRCDHAQATYTEDPATQRQSVVIPQENPQPGAQWVHNLYQFMCFSSCVGGLNRRPVNIVFTLEHGGAVLGRAVVGLRVCACPGRDRRIEEEAANPGQNKRKATPAGGNKRRRVAGPTGGTGDVYTLSIRGKDNYELLAKLRDSLEIAAGLAETDVKPTVVNGAGFMTSEVTGTAYRTIRVNSTAAQQVAQTPAVFKLS